MFLQNKGEVICKLESTPYTGETLADADNNVRFNAPPEYSPNIDIYRRKILDGTLDQWTGVAGKQSCSVTVKVDLTPGATATTEPAWSKLLQMAGFYATGWDTNAEVAVGSAASGISWRPHAGYTHVPGTVEIQEINEGAAADTPSMLVTRLVGAMCNVRFFIAKVGEPVQMEFTISGQLASMADRAYGNKLDLTSPSTIVPPAFMGITTLNLGAVSQDLDSFEININNDVQEWPDPTATGGIKGFYVAGNDPQMTMDPTLKLLATESFWAAWTGETTAALSVVMGSTPQLTMSGPALQYIGASFPERNGARVNSKTLLFTSNEGQSPNAVFELLQGAKT